MTTTTSLIDFDQIQKSFTTDEGVNHVLRGINLKVAKGSIFGVIGYSGAGKSTLIRCINGLEQPTNGTLRFKDQIVNHLDHRGLLKLRGEISMIFQQFNLMPERTIAENVALPIKYHKISKSERIKKVKQLLKLVGLPDKYSVYPSALSGGQKQRVAIARALINDPEVLLCDEATSALDPETTDSILSLLKKLNRDYGITIIVVTHEMHVIETICDRVAVLDQGKIVEQGDIYDVFAHPQSTLTKKFVNTVADINLPIDFIRELRLSDNQQLLQLTYQSGETVHPIISELSRRFNIDVNIITGDIKLIQNKLLGNLIVVLSGKQADLASTRDYLDQQSNIDVEVINHVK